MRAVSYTHLDVYKRQVGAGAGAVSSSITAASAAGHGAGLIASPLTALTSDGRDALFAEVSAAQAALGEPAVRCLRLPTAASDGYTRAFAAELGYDTLQWDIDAGQASTAPLPDDANRAAEALLAQLFPGAVVRLEAGDGDAGNEALVTTLAALLPALGQQGYSVEALCR